MTPYEQLLENQELEKKLETLIYYGGNVSPQVLRLQGLVLPIHDRVDGLIVKCINWKLARYHQRDKRNELQLVIETMFNTKTFSQKITTSKEINAIDSQLFKTLDKFNRMRNNLAHFDNIKKFSDIVIYADALKLTHEAISQTWRQVGLLQTLL